VDCFPDAKFSFAFRYSPNIKEIKILDRKKVRRAKLYYLRDRMNALKK
jgi:large subunit ribosomal protein L19